LHPVVQLERREAVSVARVVRPPLYCASLKCGVKHCDLHVVVHAIAQSGAQKSEMDEAVGKWKIDELECRSGHHAKQLATLLYSHIFDPEPD